MRDELFAVLRASVITATEIGPEHVNDAMTRGTLEQALTSRAAPMIRLASVGDPTTIVRYLVCTFAKWPELGEVLLTTVQCSECANGILALSPDQATLFIPLLQLLVAQGRLPKAAQNAAKDGLYRLGRGPVDEDGETQPVDHQDEGTRPNSLMGRARSDHDDDDGGASSDMGSFALVGEAMVTRLWFDRCSIRV
jgi:hypothetical protein